MYEAGWPLSFKAKDRSSCELWVRAADDLSKQLRNGNVQLKREALREFSKACIAVGLPKSLVRTHCGSVKTLILTKWADPITYHRVDMPEGIQQIDLEICNFYSQVCAPVLNEREPDHQKSVPRKRGRPPQTSLLPSDYELVQRWTRSGRFTQSERLASKEACDREMKRLEGSTAKALRRDRRIKQRTNSRCR